MNSLGRDRALLVGSWWFLESLAFCRLEDPVELLLDWWEL